MTVDQLAHQYTHQSQSHSQRPPSTWQFRSLLLLSQVDSKEYEPRNKEAQEKVCKEPSKRALLLRIKAIEHFLPKFLEVDRFCPRGKGLVSLIVIFTEHGFPCSLPSEVPLATSMEAIPKLGLCDRPVRWAWARRCRDELVVGLRLTREAHFDGTASVDAVRLNLVTEGQSTARTRRSIQHDRSRTELMSDRS
jgi:hypothetical protein